MKEHRIKIKVFSVRPECYGPYDRLVWATSSRFGGLEGCIRSTDCSLEIGDYDGEEHDATVVEFLNGRVLISLI